MLLSNRQVVLPSTGVPCRGESADGSHQCEGHVPGRIVTPAYTYFRALAYPRTRISLHKPYLTPQTVRISGHTLRFPDMPVHNSGHTPLAQV